MSACPACGHENPDGQKFCGECAAPLHPSATRREQRKTVTVVFCDLVGSTALGESRDPEAVQLLLNRYFERMRGIVERHGGTVEKFIGDAVVAVFGVPLLHEDDALRAVRAAEEMRNAVPELGLQARFGVNTGVVVESRETLVSGDPVNVAARLEQAAAPGEILIGAETLVLTRDAVSVEKLEPLGLKGKQKPVAAFRLLEVGEAPEGRHDARFVGRGEELADLLATWARAVEDSCCELVTVVGEAGVGKSRLVAELIASLDARVVRGRCLSYGEGITYFPVVEVIKQLDALPTDPAAAAAIRSLLGESEAPTSPDEIAWAFRKLLEASAPLVVVLDDIQWGDETFLDLVEDLARLSTGAPLLLLCLARPELSERRPGLPIALRLDPLPASDVEDLLSASVPAGLGERIARAAGGNPLFVTEMVAMAADASEEVVVPPTLKALLAARLDRLEATERGVLERGSVEGELFHRGAVQALAPAEEQVGPRLIALVRKELIRPGRPMLPAEDGFRFCHLLMRDAAYDALPKMIRAELHERFAVWLDQHGAALVERDELVGYHLEQAYRCRADLGQSDEETRSLGDRAAARLAAAARRAGTRSDHHSVANLLERALSLGVADPRERVRLQVELGSALAHTPRMAEAETTLTVAHDLAAALDERGLAARALIRRAWNRTGHPEYDQAEEQAVCERAIETLAEVGDDHTLVDAHRLLAVMFAHDGFTVAAGVELERALAHAEACDDQEMRRGVVNTLTNGFIVAGPMPVGEGIVRCEELLASARGDRVLEATVKRPLAALYAMASKPGEALELLAQAGLVLDEFNLRSTQLYRLIVAYARELADDRAGAEHELETMWLYFRGVRGDTVDVRACRAAVELARLYCDARRWDEARELVAYVPADITGLSVGTITMIRLAVEARLAAHDGRLGEAVSLAEQAVATKTRDQNLNLMASVWLARAEVQRAAGSTVEADAAVSAALNLYDQKGNIAAAAHLRAAVPEGTR